MKTKAKSFPSLPPQLNKYNQQEVAGLLFDWLKEVAIAVQKKVSKIADDDEVIDVVLLTIKAVFERYEKIIDKNPKQQILDILHKKNVDIYRKKIAKKNIQNKTYYTDEFDEPKKNSTYLQYQEEVKSAVEVMRNFLMREHPAYLKVFDDYMLEEVTYLQLANGDKAQANVYKVQVNRLKKILQDEFGDWNSKTSSFKNQRYATQK